MLPLKAWAFRTLAPHLTWVALGRVRNSFISKALSAMSLSAMVLANLADVSARLGIPLDSFRTFLVGGALFLAGFLLHALWVPSEFRQDGEIHDHVFRIMQISDDQLLASRIGMARAFLARARSERIFPAPAASLANLEAKLAEIAAKPLPQVGSSDRAGFYRTDLTVKQFDMGAKRVCVAVMLAAGALVLLAPTIGNILKVTLGS